MVKMYSYFFLHLTMRSCAYKELSIYSCRKYYISERTRHESRVITSCHSSGASFDPRLREFQWRAEYGSLRLSSTIGKTESLKIVYGQLGDLTTQ